MFARKHLICQVNEGLKALRVNHFAVFTLLASWSAPMPAQPPAAAATIAPPADKTLNPNEVVCEKQEQLGSRLATKRICMTRGQWADLRGQDRQEIERVQTQRGQMAPH